MSNEMSAVVIDKISYPAHIEVVELIYTMVSQIREMQADNAELLEALEITIPHLESICEHNKRVSNGIPSELDERDLATVRVAIAKHKAGKEDQMSKLNDLKMLDNLSEALGDSDGQTPDEIRQELREDGVDIESMEASIKAHIVRLGGSGVCKKCGQLVSNLAFHESRDCEA